MWRVIDHIFLFYRTSINYLLLNLAVTDMTLATFFMPQYTLIHTFTHLDGVTGDMLCKLLTGGSLASVGGATSVFTLVTIAIERYYAVMYPHGNKGKLTNRKLKVWLCVMVSLSTVNCQFFLAFAETCLIHAAKFSYLELGDKFVFDKLCL